MNIVTHDELVRKAQAYWAAPTLDRDEDPPTAYTTLTCDECGDLCDMVVELAGVTICPVCCCRAVEQLKTWRVERGTS